MSTTTVITWKTGQHGAKYGYVGTTRVFGIISGLANDSWQLKANLPGIKQNTEHISESAAQAAAETMLQIHFNSLVAAGVKAPEVIDAALDARLLEETAQAIAKVALKAEGDWNLTWSELAATERLTFRLKAQAALKA